jgi:hypothetical protein
VNWLFDTGLILLAAAAAAGLAAVRPSWARGLPYGLGAAGSACLAAAGAFAVAGHAVRAGSAAWLGEGLPGQGSTRWSRRRGRPSPGPRRR